MAFNTLDPLAISRDGSRIVFSAATGTANQFYSRAIDELDAVPVRGPEGQVGSFVVSPDGEWIAYNDSDDGMLKRVRITGGPPASICKTGLGLQGGGWGGAT